MPAASPGEPTPHSSVKMVSLLVSPIYNLHFEIFTCGTIHIQSSTYDCHPHHPFSVEMASDLSSLLQFTICSLNLKTHIPVLHIHFHFVQLETEVRTTQKVTMSLTHKGKEIKRTPSQSDLKDLLTFLKKNGEPQNITIICDSDLTIKSDSGQNSQFFLCLVVFLAALPALYL